MKRSEKVGEKIKPVRFYNSLIGQIKTNKAAFTVFLILRILVIAVIIRCAFEKRYESVFVGVLALTLFLLPPFLEKNLKIKLPTVLESLAFAFIFCAEILGEIEGFYVKYSFWDTMLHGANGFMFAAFGFCLVDILNRSPRFRFRLSPAFLALTAFCFSMTVGVLWEFFEFSADKIMLYDMQKDFIITDFGSILLDPSTTATDVAKEIVKTTVETADGSVYVINGYIDVGLTDTMKDLFTNFIGAVIFSVIGFFYIKHRGKSKIAGHFIPVFVSDEENAGSTDGAENPDGTESAENPDGANLSNSAESTENIPAETHEHSAEADKHHAETDETDETDEIQP